MCLLLYISTQCDLQKNNPRWWCWRHSTSAICGRISHVRILELQGTGCYKCAKCCGRGLLLFRCSLWLCYGYLRGDSSIIVVNLIGMVLQFSYTVVFFRYVESKVGVEVVVSTTPLSSHYMLCLIFRWRWGEMLP